MEEEHRHCRVCGKVCGPEEEYCGKACRRKREQTIQTRRNYVYLLYALVAATTLILILSYLHL